MNMGTGQTILKGVQQGSIFGPIVLRASVLKCDSMELIHWFEHIQMKANPAMLQAISLRPINLDQRSA